MKKTLFILLMLIYGSISAQNFKHLFVKELPFGTSHDSIVVWDGATKQFKYVLQSSIGGGADLEATLGEGDTAALNQNMNFQSGIIRNYSGTVGVNAYTEILSDILKTKKTKVYGEEYFAVKSDAIEAKYGAMYSLMMPTYQASGTFRSRFPKSDLKTLTTSVNSIFANDAGNIELNSNDVPYDNTTSELTATNVQDAIDELVAGSSGETQDLQTVTDEGNHTTNSISIGNLADSYVDITGKELSIHQVSMNRLTKLSLFQLLFQDNSVKAEINYKSGNASLSIANSGTTERYIPVSVNGIYSNNTGNIEINSSNIDNDSPVFGMTITHALATLHNALDDKQDEITGAASTIVEDNLTNNRVLISNGSGKVAVSAITTTTLSYLDATSSIQTQFNGKLANLVEDTTPQLGGDLDLNGFTINNGTDDIVLDSGTTTLTVHNDVENVSIQNGDLIVEDGFVQADYFVSNNGTATSTGTAIALSTNITGAIYNYASPSTANTFTYTGALKPGWYAENFIDTTGDVSFPVLTGGTLKAGSVFQEGQIYKMVLTSYNGTTVDYYFIRQ